MTLLTKLFDERAITSSGGQNERVFGDPPAFTVPSAFHNARLFLSSQPAALNQIIVDDGLYVNGHWYGGFSGANNPGVGNAPASAYQGVGPIEITGDLRVDGTIRVQLMDRGGDVYCNSEIYLIAE